MLFKKKTAPTIENVELSEKNIKPRFIFFILFLLVAIAAFAIAITSLLSVDDGWTEISVDSAAEVNCGSEFEFDYCLGVSGKSANVEKKQLTLLYTESMVRAYRIFNAENIFSDVNNVCFINKNPNTELTVEPELYEAFELLEKYGNRNIYLAPLYVDLYYDLFFCNDDYEATNYDPFTSDEVKVHFAKVAEFVRNSDNISVQLLGDNKIILKVSKEYLDFATDNGMETLIDFAWMKNAFIADMIADVMIENGLLRGVITSSDGYTRKFDNSSNKFLYNVFTSSGCAATVEYTGSRSFVRLRDFVLGSSDSGRYYAYDNGATRTLYLSLDDGLCKSSLPELDAYSVDLSCAELLMNVSPLYIAENAHTSDFIALTGKNIYVIFSLENKLYFTDSAVTFSSIFHDFSTEILK